MIIYRNYKTFSDSDYEQRMFDEQQGSTGPGIGTYLAGGALATGGAFLAAKKGMFGGSARNWAGKAWAKGGKMLGNQSMIKSGLEDAAIGTHGKDAFNAMKEVDKTKAMNSIAGEVGLGYKAGAKGAEGAWVKAEEATGVKGLSSGGAGIDMENLTKDQQARYKSILNNMKTAAKGGEKSLNEAGMLKWLRDNNIKGVDKLTDAQGNIIDKAAIREAFEAQAAKTFQNGMKAQSKSFRNFQKAAKANGGMDKYAQSLVDNKILNGTDLFNKKTGVLNQEALQKQLNDVNVRREMQKHINRGGISRQDRLNNVHTYLNNKRAGSAVVL